MHSMKRSYSISLIIVVLWSCFCTMALAQIPQLKTETRAVWLTTLSGLDWPRTKATNEANRERQKQELIQILDRYQRLHINTVLLQTRVRGTMIYPSALEGWDPCLTGTSGKDPGYDPLSFAIEECHKRGMELHCWMVSIPSGNASVHKMLGNKTFTKTHPELAKRVKDYWYLDPGHPDTRYYLASLCREIVECYDVDGIHFDFIRYPETSTEIVDRTSWAKYGSKSGKSKADWRRDNITAIVREAFNTIKNIKPWVKVTCAPLGKFADTNRYSAGNWNSYHRVFQDAQLWMKEGIIDGIFPMLYYRDNNFYPFVSDWIENSNGRSVTAGLGIYFMHPREGKWTLDMVKRQMNFSRSKGIGVAHYRSQFLTENTKGLYDWCESEFYPYPSLTFGLPWVEKKAPQTPGHLQRKSENGQTLLSWDAVTDAEYHTYVTYNVYRSTNGPVNIQSPSHLFAARLMENQLTIPENGDTKYYYAITACDRFGNESLPLQEMEMAPLGELHIQNNTLHVPELDKCATLQICDLTERVLLTYSYASTVDVSELSHGAYWVKATFQDQHTERLGMVFK